MAIPKWPIRNQGPAHLPCPPRPIPPSLPPSRPIPPSLPPSPPVGPNLSHHKSEGAGRGLDPRWGPVNRGRAILPPPPPPRGPTSKSTPPPPGPRPAPTPANPLTPSTALSLAGLKKDKPAHLRWRLCTPRACPVPPPLPVPCLHRPTARGQRRAVVVAASAPHRGRPTWAAQARPTRLPKPPTAAWAAADRAPPGSAHQRRVKEPSGGYRDPPQAQFPPPPPASASAPRQPRPGKGPEPTATVLTAPRQWHLPRAALPPPPPPQPAPAQK